MKSATLLKKETVASVINHLCEFGEIFWNTVLQILQNIYEHLILKSAYGSRGVHSLAMCHF